MVASCQVVVAHLHGRLASRSFSEEGYVNSMPSDLLHPLKQVEERHEEELILLMQQHEAALAEERQRAGAAAAQAARQQADALEALAVEHEQQVCWFGLV